MGIPQCILLTLIILSLGVSLARNGEPKKENHSFLASLVASSIQILLLYYGGFFK